MLGFLRRDPRSAGSATHGEVVRNLDAPDAADPSLEEHERDILAGVRRRIASDDFDVPARQDGPERTLRAVLHVPGPMLAIGRETWRQASSISAIAASVAGFTTDFEPDQARRIGLLANLGKASLYEMIRREAADRPVGPSLCARLFREGHERAGDFLARAWKLEDEIASVCRCHHDWEENEAHGQAAALVSFSEKVDLALSLGLQARFEEMVRTPELDVLDVPPDLWWDTLMAASVAFAEASSDVSG